ncbi:MAG: ribosome recycling factor [Clostridia bacterium]|nr:ribosome recycling factor [Clostridia bacterium]
MKLDTKEFEIKMGKSIDAYRSQLMTMRAGRATPDVLSKIMVDYYGCPTAVNQMAEVKVTDARTLTITPWDSTTLKSIEKAIQISDLGINPQNDGRIIRLVFPQLTEERRKEMTKQISKMGEDAKVAIRNIRRDANDKIKDMKKNSEMTEDEAKASDKSIQDLTDKYVKEIDAVTAMKNKEIMEI